MIILSSSDPPANNQNAFFYYPTRGLWMNEWMNEWCIYIALYCVLPYTQSAYNHVGGHSSTTTCIIHSARGYNRHPRITTAHSAQISTALLGCKVAKLREFVCVDCVRRMLFIQDLQPDNLGIYWLDYSYNEVWAIQITGVLPEVNVGSKHIKYAQWDFFFIARLKIQENI